MNVNVVIVVIDVMVMSMTTSELAGCLTWIGAISTDMNHVELVNVMKIMIGEGEMTGIVEAVSIKFILSHFRIDSS